jgi:cysteine desulfurase / selenocysteine lyase
MSSTPASSTNSSHDFSIPSGVAYLNAAYFGPLPNCTQKAMQEAITLQQNPSFLDYRWIDFPKRSKEAFAKLVGSPADHVSLHTSTSEVISLIAQSLTQTPSLPKKPHIMLLQGEYPSDVLPWLFLKEKGLCDVSILPRFGLMDDPKTFFKNIPASVTTFVFSHVCFQTGEQLPVEAILRETAARRIDAILDVTQSLGGMPLNYEIVSNTAAIVCSTYKWMLAPYGGACAAWSPDFLKKVQPSQWSWLSMAHAPYRLTEYTTDQKPGAMKLDRGQSPCPVINAGMAASFEYLLKTGLANVYDHNQKLATQFLQSFPKEKFELSANPNGSNIVCLRSKSHSGEKIKEALAQHKVDVSVREGNLRISFHLFNTGKDVDQLLGALSSLI